MFKALKRFALGAMLVLGTALPVAAQITIPNSFVTRQVISSSKMNANFNQLGLQALNRTAPVLQATLVGDTNAAYDLGSAAVAFRNEYLSGSLEFTTNSAYLAAGTVFKSAANGLWLAAATGSGNDFILTNPSGASAIINVPTGTLNVQLGGSLQLLTATAAPGAAGISKNAVDGLLLQSATGTTYDFVLTAAGGGNTIQELTGTQNIQFGGYAQFINNTSTFPSGSIFKHSADGLTLVEVTGSTYDFVLCNINCVSGIILVPTGTQNVQLTGDLQFLSNYAGAFAQAMLAKHATYGLVMEAATGSSYDFGILNPGASTFILTVPTGTLTANFNGNINSTSAGTDTFGTTSLSTNAAVVIATGAPASAVGPYLELDRGANIFGRIGSVAALIGGTSNDLIMGTWMVANLEFATNATQRWGINSSGDFVIGASLDIFASVGTPTITSNFSTGASTIVGNDSIFRVTVGTTPGASGTVTFGHAFTNAPVCTASQNVGGALTTSTTTTIVTVAEASGNYTQGQFVYVHCLSY